MREAAAPLSIAGALEAALAAQRQGRLDDAQAIYEAVLRLAPRDFDALHLLGVVRHRQGRHDEAVALIEAALSQQPASGAALNNLANALRDGGRFADALARYDAALERVGPADAAGVWTNRGMAGLAAGCHGQAAADFRRAQALAPDAVDAHLFEGMARLALGDYAHGWRLYEWRWRKPELEARLRDVRAERWTGGQFLQGRRLRLVHEQGYGDTLMAIRYVPLLQARGAIVQLSAPGALRDLLAASFPGMEVVAAGQRVAHDLYCPVMSLPLCFGTLLDSVPAGVPYLRPPAARLADWRARFGPRLRPRVGIAWSGNPRHENDRNRSLPARVLASLRVDGIQAFSLQRELREADVAAMREASIESLPAGLGDFADAAAAILQMDLVISVDTAMAHLAGALGKPMWVLLPHAADWRWLEGREDSPWYPTARLFRQPVAGGWDEVAARVLAALPALVGALRRP